MDFRLIFSCGFDLSVGVVGTVAVVCVVAGNVVGVVVTVSVVAVVVTVGVVGVVVTIGVVGIPIGVMSGRVGRGGKKESSQGYPVEREVNSSEK